MKNKFVFNTAVNIQGKWFLPFQQYDIEGEIMLPLVEHRTRSQTLFIPSGPTQTHYVIIINDEEYFIPSVAGAIYNKIIPEKYVNRNRLFYERGSDNIRDYVQAAMDYLNIEIRYRPEFASWYRERFSKFPQRLPDKEGVKSETIEKDAAHKTAIIPNREEMDNDGHL